MKSALLAALVFATVLAVAAAAPAAKPVKSPKPVKGGHYSGSIKNKMGQTFPGTTITFTVSKDGKFVEHTRIKDFIPNSCGSGGPPPKQSSPRASISSKGKFTAKLTQGKFVSATVSGTFLKNRREQGTIKAKLKGDAACNGTFSYSTKAK